MGDEGFEHVVEVMGRVPGRSERPREVSETGGEDDVDALEQAS